MVRIQINMEKQIRNKYAGLSFCLDGTLMRICSLLLLVGMSVRGFAQVDERLCRSDYKLDSLQTGVLAFELDNLSFFKDNEFAGSVMKGYSLPGLWLQPKLTYQPLANVRLELGAHALIYSGAYQYPVYAYHDIALWKGQQYQKGCHLLPFFRAQFSLRNLNLILGDIYGGSNHGLVDPLFNPELNLTADPEMGFQLLYDLPRYHLDAWINWQSFIFDEDTHQEAFTVGFSSQISYNSPTASVYFYSPVQVTIQHRGGEQDETDAGVQTLMNGAAGVGMQWNAGRKVLTRTNVDACVVGSYQESGELWPFSKGGGWFVSASADLWDALHCKAGYFSGKDFVSLLGIPYYGTLSLKNPGGVYDGTRTVYGSVEYARTFARHYVLGAKVDGYYVMSGRMTRTDGTWEPAASSTNVSFGVYFRINPSFLLKRFR